MRKKQSVVNVALAVAVILSMAATASAATYAEWIATTSLTGPDAATTADPDGDGYTNIYEFAMAGMDPEVKDRPDVSLMWQVETATDTFDTVPAAWPGNTAVVHLVLKYKLRASTTGVTVTPQQSRSLELDTWAWGDSAFDTTWTSGDYTYARAKSNTSNWQKGFLRLWVEES